MAASTKGLVNIADDRADCTIDDFSVPELVGKKEYFILNADGDYIFNFGKMHLEHKLLDVANRDDGYLRWMIKQGKQSMDNKDGFPDDVLKLVQQARDKVKAASLATRMDLVDMMEEKAKVI